MKVVEQSLALESCWRLSIRWWVGMCRHLQNPERQSRHRAGDNALLYPRHACDVQRGGVQLERARVHVQAKGDRTHLSFWPTVSLLLGGRSGLCSVRRDCWVGHRSLSAGPEVRKASAAPYAAAPLTHCTLLPLHCNRIHSILRQQQSEQQDTHTQAWQDKHGFRSPGPYLS
jgi:hypothetical protein